jgi:hypothetical protein
MKIVYQKEVGVLLPKKDLYSMDTGLQRWFYYMYVHSLPIIYLQRTPVVPIRTVAPLWSRESPMDRDWWRSKPSKSMGAS